MTRAEELKEKIINLYFHQNKTQPEIAKELKTGYKTISKALKLANLEPKKRTDISHKKYQYDQNFFKKIDTEEKAYFLGFLYADGSLNKERYSISMTLHHKDKEIINKICKHIYNDDFPLVYDREGRHIRMGFNSKIMYEDAEKLGLHQRKSFTIKFPTNEMVPEELMHHFIRGYFDGDGCIYHTDPNKKTIRASVMIIGSLEFIDSLKDRLKKIVKDKVGEAKHRSCKFVKCVVLTSTESVKDFYNYIYRNATLFLERKKNKFNNFFKIKKEKTYRHARNLSNRSLPH